MTYPVQNRKQFSREGPDNSEVQIIGLELAVRDYNGREHELEMVKAVHTIARDHPAHPHEIRVTIHTSDGDITLINRRGFMTGTYYV